MSDNIYDYIKENFNIEITDYQFKRDYIKEPLKRNKKGCCYIIEKPNKEDIFYLYVTRGLERKNISKILSVGEHYIIDILRYYSIKKKHKEKTLNDIGITKEELFKLYNIENIPGYELSKKLSLTYNNLNKLLKKYGIKKSQSARIELFKDTNLERYGVEYYNNSEKRKQTNIKKYGVEYYTQTNEYKDKVKETKQKKYNDENYNNRLKCTQTNLERYGCENPFQNIKIKEKIKQTNLERYGCEYYTQTNEYKDKVKETNMEKYGCENVSRKDIPIITQTILDDKDLLKTYIESNNIINGKQLSEFLEVSSSLGSKYAKKYDLQYLFDYSKSIQETEIRDYINKCFETENNTKEYLNGKEIDIFIPEKNIGIEFNGNFWHGEYKRDKLYHQEKSLLAENKGLFIYHIFEYEWNTKKEQILNQLNNLLGINEIKIYARKCEIRNVENKVKSDFLIKNHLQGDDKSSIKLGLYYDNELVSLMTFVKPRFNKNYEWELSRFCGKANCNVVGGASKLFKYFIKTYNPKSIISYSNIAHTKGNLYKMLGMKLIEISKPNYVWCNHSNILTRYQCQKHKLLGQGYEGISETDIMHNRGYFRIYDCGNKVWVWKK